jgi:hypothetical protein
LAWAPLAAVVPVPPVVLGVAAAVPVLAAGCALLELEPELPQAVTTSAAALSMSAPSHLLRPRKVEL